MVFWVAGDNMEFNRFLHENKLGLSAIGIVMGVPLTLISILSSMYSDGDTGLIQFSHDLFGTWAFWIILPGLAMLLIGIYYIYDFYKKLKEFKGLIDIESKAKFIKNQDRIEELAWNLHPNYEKIVIDKKKKYKIK